MPIAGRCPLAEAQKDLITLGGTAEHIVRCQLLFGWIPRVFALKNPSPNRAVIFPIPSPFRNIHSTGRAIVSINGGSEDLSNLCGRSGPPKVMPAHMSAFNGVMA